MPVLPFSKMRLRLQIEALLLGFVAISVLSSYLVEHFVVYGSFVELERRQAEESLQRCVESLEREREALQNTSAGWAMADEFYAYAVDQRGATAGSYVSEASFAKLDVDLIAWFDLSGQLRWGNYRAPESGALVPLAPEAEAWLPALLDSVSRDGPACDTALVMASRGPMVVSACQILDERRSGPHRGVVVLGRQVDDVLQAELVRQTRVDFRFWSVADMPPTERPLLAEATPGVPVIAESPGGEFLQAFQILPDAAGVPVLVLRALLPRDITMEGRWAVRVSIAMNVAAALVLLAVVGLLLDRIVTRPIHRLTAAIVEIRRSEHLSERVPDLARNEIGALAAEFNLMLARLERDNTTRVLMMEELRRLSERDGLTNLLNRRQFDTILAEEWSRNARHQLPMSIAMLDVDYFKHYNDLHGHQAGDQVLIRVASAVKGTMRRPGDAAARYGGEEFAVIMPATDQIGALQRAENICTAIRELGISRDGCPENGVITVSVGVATVVPGTEFSPEALFHRADQALYQAKAQGRDRVVQAAI